MGTYPQTGVGGLVLAAGHGWLARIYGFSVDNLVEVEVVLATGEVVVANDGNEHASLIKGCRGGGGNFGIVTKFTLKVFQLPSCCYGGNKVFLTPTLSSAVKVMKNFDRYITELPSHLTAMAMVLGGDVVVPTKFVYFGEEKDLRKIEWLNERTNLGGWMTVVNDIKPRSYHSELQTMTVDKITSGNFYTSLIQVVSIRYMKHISFSVVCS